MNVNRAKKRGRVLHSMIEFEREFFPRSFEKRRTATQTDAHAQGISLANESLDKIRQQLVDK